MFHSRKTEAIVLKRRNFGEADKILTLFSKHYGKIKAIAKGVRKTTSRKSGSLELFNCCYLLLAEGRNLDIIVEVQAVDSHQDWRKNLIKVSVAYYFCELVDKLTAEEQTHLPVYELLKNSLEKINRSNLTALVRSFEEQLLDELGFGIPENIRQQPGSLKKYLEQITERQITSPKLVKS